MSARARARARARERERGGGGERETERERESQLMPAITMLDPFSRAACLDCCPQQLIEL